MLRSETNHQWTEFRIYSFAPYQLLQLLLKCFCITGILERKSEDELPGVVMKEGIDFQKYLFDFRISVTVPHPAYKRVIRRRRQSPLLNTRQSFFTRHWVAFSTLRIMINPYHYHKYSDILSVSLSCRLLTMCKFDFMEADLVGDAENDMGGVDM